MSDTSARLRSLLGFGADASVDIANRHTSSALLRHKREGMDLSVRARWAALVVIAIMLPFLNPSWEMLYYYPFLAAMALVGWAHRRIGRVGQSRAELALLFVDLVLLTFVLAMPNPFSANDWPTAANYGFGNFAYFYVILAAGTLAYSWRTITAIGTWTAVLWLSGAVLVWMFGQTRPELTPALLQAVGGDTRLLELINLNSVRFDVRIQEVVVFVIVAITLSLSVRRFNLLLLGNAALERERANLSRYFSPNVVDELSQNDEPLKQTRTHDVAVLFVDLVGFTSYAAKRPPQEVIETLRGFHALMETEVFGHGGTLDKYLGDGLMATFGTPRPGQQDAVNALDCARAMMAAMTGWNAARRAAGQPELRASFGLHFGPVVLGNIGANRLEFAVIGNTVNVASRLEAMSRSLDASLVISDPMRARVIDETAGDGQPRALDGLEARPPQQVRGLDQPMSVWTLRSPETGLDPRL